MITKRPAEVGVRESDMMEAFFVDGIAYLTLPKGDGPHYTPLWPLGMPVKHYTMVARIMNAVFFLAGPTMPSSGETYKNFEVVGYVKRFDCVDPFFWDSQLDDMWVKDLSKMVKITQEGGNKHV